MVPAPIHRVGICQGGLIVELSAWWLLQKQELACLAFMNGNILACINDGCADPFEAEAEPPEDQLANVELIPIAVGKWPFLFVIATADIDRGQPASHSAHNSAA